MKRKSPRPGCVLVTGRPGSGKTTLARKLAGLLRMPLVSRDEVKEGYVNTFGVRHGRLPADTLVAQHMGDDERQSISSVV